MAQKESMNQRKWRVAALDHYRSKGYGGHGTDVAFLGLPGVAMCAVCDPDEESCRAMQERTGAPKAYTDWRELLERERPDVVCICPREPIAHPELVIGAAQAGCHIYCEKPFATTLAEADQMVAAANSNGVKLTVAHLARYSRSFQTAKRIIKQGEIGRPLMAYCRGKEDQRGGGEDMMVLGTHVLDIARFLFGNPSWVSGHVSCNGQPMTRDNRHDPTEPVGPVAGDKIVATFGFPNDVHCIFESQKDLSEDSSRMGITVVGTKGQLAFRYYDDRRILRICRSATPFEEASQFEEVVELSWPEIPGATPLEQDGDIHSTKTYFSHSNRQAAWDLLCAVIEDRPPLSSGHDARWALEMIHGVYTSHLTGRHTPLPLAKRQHPLKLGDGSAALLS